MNTPSPITRSAKLAPRCRDVDVSRPTAVTRVAWLVSVGVSVSLSGLGCSDGGPTKHGLPGVYRSHCVACHGEAGDGRGPAAASLRPAPPDFADASWQESRSDEQLRAVIRDGGAAHGKSAYMPGHAHLSDADLDSLVTWIRTHAPAPSSPT